MTTALTEAIRTDLGIRNQSRDNDIASVILSAEADLRRRGVTAIDETDDSIVTAVKLFCRFWYNFQGDAARYFANYEAYANGLAMGGELEPEVADP